MKPLSIKEQIDNLGYVKTLNFNSLILPLTGGKKKQSKREKNDLKCMQPTKHSNPVYINKTFKSIKKMEDKQYKKMEK